MIEIVPDWPVAKHIHAFTTTRHGGVSLPPYAQLNLGDHVGDDRQRVAQNRALLTQYAHLPESPRWLSQVHGTSVIDSQSWTMNCEADAIFSHNQNHVCAILTADCLPILLSNKAGTCIAAIHAGWRGLLSGIIEKTVAQFNMPGQDILAWLGPAIGPEQFEVGNEVFEAFESVQEHAHEAFSRTDDSHLLADIYLLARQRLQAIGIDAIYGGSWCTVTDSANFYSYRRDGITGRMATLIWISDK